MRDDVARALATKALEVAQKAKSQQGPKGEKGDAGQIIVQPNKGDQGEQGPMGPQGIPGKSIVGPKGDKGDKGDPGLKGDKGDQGAAGKDGAQGERGERGFTGLKGANGSQGPMGPMPKHEKKGLMIRFEKEPGTWGEWIIMPTGGGGGGRDDKLTDRQAELVALAEFYKTRGANANKFIKTDGTNLAWDTLDGSDINLSSPPPIGATTPSTVNATTITGQTARLNGTGQNLVLQSQTYTNATWNSSTATRADNQTTAPNGTTTAGTITSVNTTFGGLLRQFINSGTTATYTATVFVKKNNWRYVGIRFGSLVGTAERFAFFDFDTLAISTVGIAGATLTATDAGSGWYRLALTGANTTTGGFFVDVAVVASDGSHQTNTGAGNIINVWGAQMEFGSTANTYIPTTTTAVYGTPTLSFSGVSEIGLLSNGALYLQPAGTGALQAQATTSTTAGGNARGANAVDWQTSRSAASQVASVISSVIGGGANNTNTGTYSFVGSGFQNTSSANGAGVVTGATNTASGQYAFVGAGVLNTATGFYGFVGNGFTNSTTANAAVTTQSGTMNATTAVTLSGSNANIKVGQYISGTSIANDTYVAAISGTALTLSKVASGSSTSTLSFFTPHGVVVGGGNNQATGSYSFIGGGGDAGTAANRNVASGDWSAVLGGKGNIASGVGSSISGGGIFPFGDNIEGNTASGKNSFVGGGSGNNATNSNTATIGGRFSAANAQFSTAIGGYATVRSIEGNVTFGSATPLGTFAGGSSQSALLVLARQTTDATATVLTSNTAAAGTTNQVILPNNSAYLFKATVISNVTGGGNTSAWKLEGAIKRGANAASTVIVGSVTTTLLAQDAGAATWAIAATADTTNGGLRITFTGQASTTIRTVAQIRTTETTF